MGIFSLREGPLRTPGILHVLGRMTALSVFLVSAAPACRSIPTTAAAAAAEQEALVEAAVVMALAVLRSVAVVAVVEAALLALVEIMATGEPVERNTAVATGFAARTLSRESLTANASLTTLTPAT